MNTPDGSYVEWLFIDRGYAYGIRRDASGRALWLVKRRV